ncbi:hypothetical protein FRC09_019194 [Ceratobasidium sp. 395]|nr:hypothetical protein FRC09_019194 [Ceratobasidium sp. 395]
MASQDADQVIKCYRRIRTLLEILTLNANLSIQMSVNEQATCYRLDKLEPSHAAWYSSAESHKLCRDECTPDTRVQVLERFRVWRDDDEGERMYWLNGMAGTGKTTLSYTLCKQLEEDSRLAANFFCSRQLPTCRDAKRILPTIAYQFANFSYPFRYALSRVLEQSPDIHTRRISEQLTKLLLKPLREVHQSIPNDLVIVLEALDECDSPGEILDALLNLASDLPIRFFLTSRPEPEIRERMYLRSGDRKSSELHLHNIDKAIVGEDIRRYLQNGLKRINISDKDLETLTDRSGVLFIYAATVVRYVGAFNFSRSTDRLEQVLNVSTSSCDSDKEINSLYALILTDAFDDPVMTGREKEEMKLVLHTAICAQEPLSAQTMAGLLGLKRAESVHAALNPLRSVLNIQTAGEGITTLHKSFPDYMFSEARSQRFYCDVEQHHAFLSKRCLDRIQTSDPPFNVCGLKSSFTLDKHVRHLDQRIKRHISETLFYACRYWGAHLDLAGRPQGLRDDVHAFLSTRLLLWMEVMSLKRCLLDVGVKVMLQVKNYMERHKYPTKDQDLARDGCDFVDAYLASPASRGTPHIYISALSFWPPERPISVYYSRLFQSPIYRTTAFAQPHTPTPLAIYSIGSSVRCIAYSLDGTSIAAGSDDATIQLWDSNTGQRIGAPLEGHDGPISSIDYSPDGKYIASSSIDGSIRIWDVSSGRADNILRDREAGAVYSVCYVSTVFLLSGSADGKIRSWALCGEGLHDSLYEGHAEPIYSVAISPDSGRPTSGFGGGTVLRWESGGVATVEFIGHTAAVYSLAYSPDGTRFTSGSEDMTVRIWGAETGQAIGSPLRGHTAAVSSVTYSPNGSRIVSGSMDGTIRVWDSSSGEAVVGPLIGHGGPVYSVACSPDGTTIASGSADGTIRRWSIETGETIREPLKWHSRVSHFVVCSSSTALNALSSLSNVVCFWGTEGGHFQLSPSRQRMINEMLTAPSLISSVQKRFKSGEANVFCIQDRFTAQASSHQPTEKSTRKDLATISLQSSSLLETGTEFCSHWNFDREGWIMLNSIHRLAWVPSHVRDQIWNPQTAAGVISQQDALWLDLDTPMVEGKWNQCYTPPKMGEKGDLMTSVGLEQEALVDLGHLRPIIPTSSQEQNDPAGNDTVPHPNM